MASATSPSPCGDKPPSRRHFEHALLLIARQQGGSAATAESARCELDRWRLADPAHDAAYRAALRAWEATEAHALRDTFALPPPETERVRTRRRVLSALAVGGVVFGLAGAVRWVVDLPTQELALGTRTGQVQTVTLSDGTRLDVGARTAVRVAYYRDRREIRLAEGEIRLEVAPDAARPLTVATDWGRVRVLGTVFSVAVRDAQMSVAVAGGRVAVWQRGGPGDEVGERPPEAELTAGQRIEADAVRLGEIGEVRPADVGAWRQGWLVFDGVTLADAVARWNDYLATRLVLDDDPALSSLRVTGSYRVRDPGAFIKSLPAILPVRVAKGPDGAVHIEARR